MERRDFDIIQSGVDWFFYRNRTILVTGATGRLGRYIVESLLDADLRYNLDLRIIGLARSREKSEQVFPDALAFPNVTFLYQDIGGPVFYDGAVDYIFHTAGPAAPKDYFHPVDTLWAHVNGTHNVLEFARTHDTRRLFYVSTVESFGEWKSDELIREEDMGPLRHLSARACYPEAKRLCETMLSCYRDEYGIDFTGVRLCHTLGPGIALDDGRAFAEFMDCALRGEDIILHSDGSAMRTYTYTADAVNAMFIIMQKGEGGMLYNVAKNENLVSIRELAELIAGFSPSGKTRVVFSDHASKLPYLPFKLAIMDSSKARALGWQPQTDIRTTLRWTMEAFQ